MKWHCGANGMLVSAPKKLSCVTSLSGLLPQLSTSWHLFCQFLDLHCSHAVKTSSSSGIELKTSSLHHDTRTKNTPWNNKISKRFSETAHLPTLNLTSPLNFHWGPNKCRIRGGVCGHFPRILRWFKQPIWLLTFPISSVHATVCWAGISRPSTHLLNKLLWMKITADELAQLLVIFNLA